MDPDVRMELQKLLCSVGITPELMTGYLRQWFEAHFTREYEIAHPGLRNKLWSQVRTENGILVESVTNWDPSTTEMRPGILIARGKWKNLRVGIEDRIMDHHVPYREYATYFQGDHTCFCVSKIPQEAEILATEVYRELLQFGPVVREELNLMRFQLLDLDKLFQIEEAEQHYAVPVSVAYFAEERWKLIQQAPFLTRVKLSKFIP